MGWARWYLNAMLVGLLLICSVLLIYRWTILARRVEVPAPVRLAVTDTPPAATRKSSTTHQPSRGSKSAGSPAPAADPPASAIPSQSTPPQTSTLLDAQHPLEINTAQASELVALPGIGEVLAERIVEYRQRHGPFRAVRDLLQVEGIGEVKLAAIEKLVYVKPVQ